MIHLYRINGLKVQTGDLICTTDGGGGSAIGAFWWFIGKLIPGKVDHVVVYVGPGGRCVEAGAKFRVVEFNVPGNKWEAMKMKKARGGLIDKLHGVVYPLNGYNFSEQKEKKIREEVAKYCIKQAKDKKPYNLNFFNSKTEKKFYCSQLAYKAYLKHGIDLNTGKGVPNFPGTKSIIFPQEIWSGCSHKRA